MDLLDRLRLEHPIVQAGMGGGLSGAELAGAVSAAGGLGTVGIFLDPAVMREQISRARALAGGRPVAANLLVPFARLAHGEACIEGGADCVVLFCGFAPRLVARLREAGVLVLHQIGTVEQAKRALHDGADGLIAQGNDAGGHLLGEELALDFLPRALEIAEGHPVLLAGGAANGYDAWRALDAGADAVVCGSRFLLTEECAAHPGYKQRVLQSTATMETLLFSLGWYARHRVVPNAATERWCRNSRFGPAPVLALNCLTAPLLRRLPPAAAARSLRMQRPLMPLYGPSAPLNGMDDRLLDVTPLYAGESARRIESVVGAAQAVRELAAEL